MTPKQSNLLKYIAEYIEREGYSPSLAEMRDAVGLKTKSAPHRYMAIIEEQGFIERQRIKGGEKHRARSVLVTQKGYDFLKKGDHLCPRCGRPYPAFTPEGHYYFVEETNGGWGVFRKNPRELIKEFEQDWEAQNWLDRLDAKSRRTNKFHREEIITTETP